MRRTGGARRCPQPSTLPGTRAARARSAANFNNCNADGARAAQAVKPLALLILVRELPDRAGFPPMAMREQTVAFALATVDALAAGRQDRFVVRFKFVGPAIEDLRIHEGVVERLRDASLADVEIQDLVYQMRGGCEQRASRAALRALEAAGRLTMLLQDGSLQDRRRWLPLIPKVDFRPDPLQKAWIAYVYGEPSRSADSTIIF
eukprot:tig00020545_g10454.t1